MNAKHETDAAIVVLPTVGERQLSEMIRMDPLGVFLEHPLWSVRDECLNVMNKWDNFPKSLANLAEEVILALNAQRDRRAENLLECLVLGANGEAVPAAIEFAIHHAMKNTLVMNHVAKLVIAKFSKNNFSSCAGYWGVPSMEQFIGLMLEQIRRKDFDYEYTDSDWTDVKRALNIIIKYSDTTFLHTLTGILDEIKSGKIKRWKHGDENSLEVADDIHFLQTRTKLLQEIAKTEIPNLGLDIEPFIRRDAKIKGNVEIQLLYQGVVAENNKTPIIVVFRTSRREEQCKLNKWIMSGHIIISFDAEGFANPYNSKGKFNAHSNEANWMVELQPTPGKNRVYVIFGDGHKIISSAAAYIRCTKETSVAQIAE